jgi:hypothetical protein
MTAILDWYWSCTIILFYLFILKMCFYKKKNFLTVNCSFNVNFFLKFLKFLSELQWWSESNDSAQSPRINFVYIIFALTKRVTSLWPLVMKNLIQKVTNANVVTPIKVSTTMRLLCFEIYKKTIVNEGSLWVWKMMNTTKF